MLLTLSLVTLGFHFMACTGDDDDDDATATPTPTSTATPTYTPTGTATPPLMTWNRTYGGGDDEYSRQVIQTSDNGYAVVGYTRSWGNGQDDVLVMKLDLAGNIVQQKTFGDAHNDWGNGLVQTPEGGFGVACYTAPDDGLPWDGWIFKTDASLNVVWETFFGEIEKEDGPNNLYLAHDNSLIMSGVIDKTTVETHDVLLMNISANGSISWYKQYGEEGQDKSNNMAVCSDGGYIIAAESCSHSNGLSDAWLIRTDSQGNVLWENNFGGPLLEEAFHVEQTPEGGFIVAAYTKPSLYEFSDAIILKLDQDGNEQWRKTYGSAKEDYAWSITTAQDDGYVFCGMINGDSWNSGGDGWLVKLDQNGAKVWEQTFTGAAHDELFYLIKTADGGYLATGESSSNGAGGLDIWIVKTDVNGHIQ